MKNTKHPKTTNRCDCCGKRNTVIQRRYKTEAYCPNCYRTWFVKKPCSSCGEIARLHKKEDYSLCRKCKRNEPCIRCGDEAYIDGANTEYGRVCQTCHKGYFKEKKPCELCGKLKRNLSRYKELPHDLAVCPSCYSSQVHGYCSACSHQRKLIETPKGKLCKKCYEHGEISCPSCSKLMPAGRSNQCEDCYWNSRLEQEVALNEYLLKSDSVKQSYNEFMFWFKEEKGSKTAKLKNNHFIMFFIRCEEIWGEIPKYNALVQEFKPDGLREYLTVLRWLIASEKITVELNIKEKFSEGERINNLLAKLGDETPICIKSYHTFLIKRHLERKNLLKSVRLALQPAIDLCVKYEVKASNTPNQTQIDSYLLIKHGQYNSLYGFITFLNKEYGLELNCKKPSKDDILKLNRNEIEKQVIDFLKDNTKISKATELKWLQLAMIYFHGVKISYKTLKSISIHYGFNDGMTIIKIYFKGSNYTLPLPNKEVQNFL